MKTNYTNELKIDKTLIHSNNYLFTDKYLGVPLFLSIDNGHLSFEHTHPPHEYLLGDDRYLKIKLLKKAISDILP